MNTTKAKGTGLGLAIVGRIIETHRGSIRIKSRLHHGTSIILTLAGPAEADGSRMPESRNVRPVRACSSSAVNRLALFSCQTWPADLSDRIDSDFMNYSKLQWWERFQKYYTEFPNVGLAVDLSRMNVDRRVLRGDGTAVCKRRLPTWQRWKKAPSPIRMKTAWSAIIGCEIPRLRQLRKSARKLKIRPTAIKDFAAKIHAGQIRGKGGPFKNYFLIGIGGSALGPQFVAHALGILRTDKLKPFFFDNTDPDGMDRVLATIGA